MIDSKLLLNCLILSFCLSGCGGKSGSSSSTSSTAENTENTGTEKPEIDPDLPEEDKSPKNCRISENENRELHNWALYDYLFNTLKFTHKFGLFGLKGSEELNLKGAFCVNDKNKSVLELTVKSSDSVNIDLPDYTHTIFRDDKQNNPAIRALFSYVQAQEGYDYVTKKTEIVKALEKKAGDLKALRKACDANPTPECRTQETNAVARLKKWNRENYVPLIHKGLELGDAFSAYREPNSVIPYFECMTSELVMYDEVGGSEEVLAKNTGKNLYDINVTPTQVGTFSLILKLKANLKNPGCYFYKKYVGGEKPFEGKVNPEGYIYEGIAMPIMQPTLFESDSLFTKPNSFELKSERVQKLDIRLIVTP